MSAIDMPAAASISVSASRNGIRSRADSRRPMVDLPAPIMPTSTTERVPSAEVISASWDVLAPAGVAVSGISMLRWRGFPRSAPPILPLPMPLPELLQQQSEHVGIQGRFLLVNRLVRLGHSQPVPPSYCSPGHRLARLLVW